MLGWLSLGWDGQLKQIIKAREAQVSLVDYISFLIHIHFLLQIFSCSGQNWSFILEISMHGSLACDFKIKILNITGQDIWTLLLQFTGTSICLCVSTWNGRYGVVDENCLTLRSWISANTPSCTPLALAKAGRPGSPSGQISASRATDPLLKQDCLVRLVVRFLPQEQQTPWSLLKQGGATWFTKWLDVCLKNDRPLGPC